MDPRLKKLATLLVRYSTAVKPGEKVFVECEAVALPWMEAVVAEAVQAGAHVETRISAEQERWVK